MFESRLLAPSASADQTASSSEQSGNTGKEQNHFHIWFVSLSEGRYATGGDFSMGCNPTSHLRCPRANAGGNTLRGSFGFGLGWLHIRQSSQNGRGNLAMLCGVTPLKPTRPFALFFLSANGRKVPRVCEKGNAVAANCRECAAGRNGPSRRNRMKAELP
jgi:hypothetical protein